MRQLHGRTTDRPATTRRRTPRPTCQRGDQIIDVTPSPIWAILGLAPAGWLILVIVIALARKASSAEFPRVAPGDNARTSTGSGAQLFRETPTGDCRIGRGESLLSAIATIETGNHSASLGSHGERGAYQMTAAAWRDACRLQGCRHVFSLAHEQATSRSHAAVYLAFEISRLSSALGRSPTDREIYAGWNLGLAGFQRRGFSFARCPRSTRDAADRLHNLLSCPPATARNAPPKTGGKST